MATGDILSCTVLATGWQADVVVEGLSTGGTYDFGDIDADAANAKLAMTVVSEGYSTSGTLGTKTRTVYGTRVVQKSYPNQATAEETTSGGNVTLTIALSDYVYDDDKAGTAGVVSGTNPTVAIAAGWYTQGGTPNNAHLGLTVTNNSTQDYPKVIARWAVVPYQRFTSTFDLEAVAFHRFAENGKPVACVKFEATDGSNSEEVIATAMVQSSAADSLPCYQGTLTASDYTDNAVVTANFTAYPWVGDADSTRTSIGGSANALTLGPLPLLADPDDDYGVTHACVNTSTGSDTGTKAFSTLAAAQASPCASIRYALAQIAAYNNTNYGRNNANAGIIYLQSNNHSITGTGTATTGDVWVTVTRDPDVSKANACISGNPNAVLSTQRLKLMDITVIPTGFIFQGAGGRVLWMDSVTYAPASQSNSFPAWGYDLTYNTHCTADLMNQPWSNYSTGNIAALIRGCSATNVVSFGGSGIYAARCVLTSTADHNDAQAGSFWVVPTSNTVAAYCRDLRNPENGSGSLAATVAADDVAVVCNLFEDTGGTAPTALLWGDSSTTNNANLLIWHNTFAGERCNVGYNDGASAVTRSGYALKYNAFQRLATKHDVFKLDGTRTGAWSILYGVGWAGNHTESADASFPHEDGTGYAGLRWSHAAAAGYVDDNSGASGAGGGDYTPDTGSVLLGKIASAADVLIPWDINGIAYAAGGAAGAITLGGASVTAAVFLSRAATLGAGVR